MSEIQLEHFIRYVALPTALLGLYVKRLEARRADPTVARVADEELRRAERIRRRLTRQGWWN